VAAPRLGAGLRRGDLDAPRQGRTGAYRTGTADARDAAHRLFDEKLDNLAEARTFIHGKLAEYDANGKWARLDEVIKECDVEPGGGRPPTGLRPTPVPDRAGVVPVQPPVRPGARLQGLLHDDRECVAKIGALTRQGRDSFEAEYSAEHFPPYWLFKLDLNSIEVPDHCGVCRLAITYAERLLEAQS
jgi:hypothetical protein